MPWLPGAMYCAAVCKQSAPFYCSDGFRKALDKNAVRLNLPAYRACGLGSKSIAEAT